MNRCTQTAHASTRQVWISHCSWLKRTIPHRQHITPVRTRRPTRCAPRNAPTCGRLWYSSSSQCSSHSSAQCRLYQLPLGRTRNQFRRKKTILFCGPAEMLFNSIGFWRWIPYFLNCVHPETCVLLGFNAASSGNPLPKFRDSVSVPPLLGLLDPWRWDRYIVLKCW
jgi:hypothetical protein